LRFRRRAGAAAQAGNHLFAQAPGQVGNGRRTEQVTEVPLQLGVDLAINLVVAGPAGSREGNRGRLGLDRQAQGKNQKQGQER
jgi:hypothetical protein